MRYILGIAAIVAVIFAASAIDRASRSPSPLERANEELRQSNERLKVHVETMQFLKSSRPSP